MKPTKPSIFQISDIVEVQLSIKAVPLKKSQAKLIVQYKSLALLDDTLTWVSINTIHSD